MVHKVSNIRKESHMITLEKAIELYIATKTAEGLSYYYTSWLMYPKRG